MTEKELKKLNRYQLLELLITQTERADQLEKKVEELERKLEERHLEMAQLGTVAEAAVYLSGVFEAAQKAADLYVEAARKRAEGIAAQAEAPAAAEEPQTELTDPPSDGTDL